MLEVLSTSKYVLRFSWASYILSVFSLIETDFENKHDGGQCVWKGIRREAMLSNLQGCNSLIEEADTEINITV